MNAKQKPRVWMVRAGERSFLIETFLEKKIIAIGWNDVGKIETATTYDKLKEDLKAVYPDGSPGFYNQSAGQIWRFYDEFKIGDHVITYDSTSRLYYTGTIESDYDYNNDLEYHNFRKVEWNETSIGRDELSTNSKNVLGSTLTIFEIRDEVWEELQSLLSKQSYEKPKESEKSTEDMEYIISDVISRSKEFIKDAVAKLNWQEAEKLVAGLLQTMGYKTRFTSRGSDLGSDILASPDGLGMQEPRIKVEVKTRTKDKISSIDLRNFIGGLRGIDKGIFVSTTGFSKEARYEAERANFPITLIDSDLLVELIVEYYETLQPETKALVPLRRIYWPG